MTPFLSSSYGVILLIWGAAFELVGALITYVLYRAIQRHDAAENHAAEALAHPQNRPVTATVIPERPIPSEPRWDRPSEPQPEPQPPVVRHVPPSEQRQLVAGGLRRNG